MRDMRQRRKGDNVKSLAVLATAFTGILFCDDPHAFHVYAETLLGRSIWTHEFANEALWDEIKAAMRENGDFDELLRRIRNV